MQFLQKISRLFFCLLLLPGFLSAQSGANFDVDTYAQMLAENRNLSTADLIAAYPAGTFSEKITNAAKPAWLDSIDLKYHLTDYEKSLIGKNGFMVTERINPATFASALLDIYYNDLPVFISTDAILHALHMSYDEILISLEMSMLIPELKTLMAYFSGSQGTLQAKYGTSASPELQAALHDFDVYVTLTRKLLGENVAPFYSDNAAAIAQLQQYIAGAQMKQIALFSTTDRKFDFSQFTVRGHYTQNDMLGKYFQAMIWLGRTEVYLTAPKEDALQQKPEDIQRQIMLAALINEMCQSNTAMPHLQKMENIIQRFVGESDNVTVWQFDELMQDCNFADATAFADTNNVKTFQDTLKNKSYAGQKILSQILTSPMDLSQIEPASAFLLLGQRFIIDSYVFGNVVFDKILFQNSKIKRMLPSSLDVLFALGNDAALQLLQPELDDYHYAANLNSLRYLIDAYGDDFWNKSLYNGWLNSIRTLNPPADRSALPAFMRTAAWWQQKMNTQLAAWAQLRHDNLLYAKQSYTGGVGCFYPEVFVEPIPQFYAAIRRFAEEAHDYFSTLVFAQPGDKERLLAYFSNVSQTMTKLQRVAQNELDGVKISTADDEFLCKVLYDQPQGCAPVFHGWYTDLYYNQEKLTDVDLVVADVHTAPTDEFGAYVGWVKHVGTGPVNLAVVTAENGDGKNTAYIGPVLSYYEYTSTNFKRLTDEEWETMYSEAPAMRPNWTNIYLANGKGETRGAGQMLATGVENENGENGTLPDSPKLLQNWPNPFNPTTYISFVLPRSLANQPVKLSVYNVHGQLVQKLLDAPVPAGQFTVKWDGRQTDGQPVGSGVYFYTLRVANHKMSGRMTLLR